MFLFALFVLLIALPIAELFVIVRIAEAIGVLPMIGLLFLDAAVGLWLMRSQGRAAWRRFNEALASGRPPAREVLDGGLIIFGGAFLIAPGFITDVVGALLLLPPTRALARRLLVRRFARSFVLRAARRGGPRPPGAVRDYDVEGTATEVDQATLPR
jgi:UPF0716 protein FxsA